MALVTGASRGLGFLLARELAQRGHDLVLCARSAGGLDAARADLEHYGIQVLGVPADIGVAAEAGRVVDAALARFGRLDVLVCNAGLIQVGPAAAMRPDDYAQAMDVMFWGLVHPVLAALPALRRTGGRILAVTSVGGKLPAPHLLPYCAAKHAAVGFAEGLRGQRRCSPRQPSWACECTASPRSLPCGCSPGSTGCFRPRWTPARARGIGRVRRHGGSPS